LRFLRDGLRIDPFQLRLPFAVEFIHVYGAGKVEPTFGKNLTATLPPDHPASLAGHIFHCNRQMVSGDANFHRFSDMNFLNTEYRRRITIAVWRQGFQLLEGLERVSRLFRFRTTKNFW